MTITYNENEVEDLLEKLKVRLTKGYELEKTQEWQKGYDMAWKQAKENNNEKIT